MFIKCSGSIICYFCYFGVHNFFDYLQVRSIDPYVVTYMDEYAMLLKIKSDHSKLNKLVHDLLSIDPTRPEVFVALSVLWGRKDERGALSYAEKVRFISFDWTRFYSSVVFFNFPSFL